MSPDITQERRAWGKRYREFAMKFFNLDRYAYEHQQQWYEHQHQQQEAPRKNAPRPGFWKSNCIAMARAIRRGDSADDIRAMARACIAKPLQGPV